MPVIAGNVVVLSRGIGHKKGQTGWSRLPFCGGSYICLIVYSTIFINSSAQESAISFVGVSLPGMVAQP